MLQEFLDNHVFPCLQEFRRRPNDVGFSKMTISEIRKLAERISRTVEEVDHNELEERCPMLYVIRKIENSRKHYPHGGRPLIEHTDDTGILVGDGNLVCRLTDGREYPLIDVANESVAFLTDLISRQEPVD